jgi:hypothetical protein
MGTIHIDLFTTLDLVAQAPGGPDEDPEGGFPYGGWQAPLIDETVGEQVARGMEGMDALLLGRRTYDIFAGYWPHQEQGADGGIARTLNSIPKYVASRGEPGPAGAAGGLGERCRAAALRPRAGHPRHRRHDRPLTPPASGRLRLQGATAVRNGLWRNRCLLRAETAVRDRRAGFSRPRAVPARCGRRCRGGR